jgi:hypothetical protein
LLLQRKVHEVRCCVGVGIESGLFDPQGRSALIKA